MRHTYSKWRRSQNKLHAVQSTCLTLAPCVWVSLSLCVLCVCVCMCVCETVCTDCLLFWLYDTIPFSQRVVLTNCANYCVKFALEVKNHFDMDYIYFFLHSSPPLSLSLLLSATHWLSAFVCRCTHPLQVTITINVSSSPRATKHHLTIENRVSTVWAA